MKNTSNILDEILHKMLNSSAAGDEAFLSVDADAKVCGRSRRHSVEDLLNKIYSLMDKFL